MFWVLIGGGVFLFLLFGILLVLGYRSAQMFQSEGPIGILRTTIQLNPNNEILEEDPATNTVRFRNKKTGKESRYVFDPATKEFHVIEGDAVTPPPEAPRTPEAPNK